MPERAGLRAQAIWMVAIAGWSSNRTKSLIESGLAEGSEVSVQVRAEEPDRSWATPRSSARRMVELYHAGWSMREIGAELGVARTTVRYQLLAQGVELRP